MSNQDHVEGEYISVKAFFEEFWHLFFFGTFFLMTMFLPLLAMQNKGWMLGGICTVFVIILALLTLPGWLGKIKKS